MSIVLSTKTVRSTGEKKYNTLLYRNQEAILEIVSEGSADHNKLIKINLTASVYAARSASATSGVAPSGVVKATLNLSTSNYSNNFSVSAPSSNTEIPSGGRTLRNSETVYTLNRTEDYQTLTAKVTVSGNACTQSKNQTFTITIPPFKQNVMAENRRITYTSGGVKYDILNYK